MTSTVVDQPAPATEAMTTASRIPGNDSTMSSVRMMMLVGGVPEAGGGRPGRIAPAASAASVAMAPTPIDVRAPASTREKTSRPNWSVPKR